MTRIDEIVRRLHDEWAPSADGVVCDATCPEMQRFRAAVLATLEVAAQVAYTTTVPEHFLWQSRGYEGFELARCLAADAIRALAKEGK